MRSEKTLPDSVEIYRTLIDNIPDVVMRFDRACRHLFVSENVSEVVEMKAAEFIGRTHRELGFSREQCRFWEDALKKVITSGRAFETEFSFEGKKGLSFHNWRLIPELDSGGRVRSVLSISRDISAQRRAEQQYQTLFREMLNGFALHEIICDAAGRPVDYRFLAVNPAFERLTGLANEKIAGRTVLEILPKTEPFWIETYGRVALSGEPAFFENYSTELEKYFEVTAFRPAPDQFACIFQDVTVRKKTEQQLRESEARFKALHNASFGGIAIHDQGLILDFNQGLSEITGYTPEELSGMNGLLLISESTRDLVMKNIQAGYEKPYEAIGVRKNGEEYPLRLEARRIPYKGKQVRVVEFRDISESKRIQQERDQIQAQLLQAQKMESVGQLAGGVAHDFNNMLGVILGRAEMALEKLQPDSELFHDLQEISRAAERSAEIVRQLLTFARKQAVSPKVVDLNEEISGMLKMLRRLIGENLELRWHPGQGLWPVRIDPAQVNQILVNLCLNARDAVKDAGRIDIKTGNISFDRANALPDPEFRAGEYLRLSVADNGCGMDEQTLLHVFEPFFTTKPVGKGTGLGLPMVYGAVKQNDGFIQVRSNVGRGTEVSVFLPRHRGPVEMEQAETVISLVRDKLQTVLLVEDETALLKMAEVLLQRLGFKVLSASSPAEALRLAAENPAGIALLLSDVVMPVMNGRELARQVKELCPGIKTLFMSGYTAEVIARHGVLDKDLHFIQKPFSLKELGEKIGKLLESPQT